MRWERLSGLGVPVAVLGALAFIVWGVWGIDANAGKIAVGVAGLLFAFLADRDKADDIDVQAAALGAQQTSRFGTQVRA